MWLTVALALERLFRHSVINNSLVYFTLVNAFDYSLIFLMIRYSIIQFSCFIYFYNTFIVAEFYCSLNFFAFNLKLGKTSQALQQRNCLQVVYKFSRYNVYCSCYYYYCYYSSGFKATAMFRCQISKVFGFQHSLCRIL